MAKADIKAKEIAITKIDLLKPNPKNMNIHPPEQIKRLVELIEYQGFRQPIIVSNQSGFVVAGHGRLEAAHKIGLKYVPVSYQDFPNEEAETAFGISDNAIASWATLDLKNINMELGSLGPDFDLDLLGIKNFTLEPLDKKPKKDRETKDARVKAGDIFALGSHKLMCGDSTALAIITRWEADTGRHAQLLERS